MIMMFRGAFGNIGIYKGRAAMYLDWFSFATQEQEDGFRWGLKRTCYDTIYPFGVLTKHCLRRIDFEPITIFYGGNGSGKTTALNIIAEKAGVERGTLFNRSNFYENYLKLCVYESGAGLPKESRIISSDDVFDYMLNLRSINEGIRTIKCVYHAGRKS